MKVLFIGNYDMAEHNIRPEAEMIIGLKAMGLDIEVMTRADCWYAGRMASEGIKIHDFVPAGKWSRPAVREIRRVLERGRHDVVQLFNNKAIVTGLMAAWRLPVKVVTYRGQTGNISRFDPSCYLTHLSPRVDAIVCVAEAVRQSLIREVRDPSRLVTIYKGHDIRWYENISPVGREELNVPRDAFLVGCVASNRPRKGIPVLLEATRSLARHSSLHLVLVGGGMDTKQTKSLIRESPMGNRIHVLGHRDQVLPIVAACDATILPSTKREGLPKTVIESMALGVAAVVTATGGSPELVQDGHSGLVIPPADASAIDASLSRLIEEPALGKQLGQAGQQRIATHFRLEDSIRAHDRLFRSLIETKS